MKFGLSKFVRTIFSIIKILNLSSSILETVSDAPDGSHQVRSRLRHIFMTYSLLLVTTICVNSSDFALPDRTLLRQHYGVAFIPRATAMPITGHWVHTFGLRLPDRPIFERNGRQLNCSQVNAANVSHCMRVKPFLDKLQEFQTDMTNTLLDVLLSIEELVPHTSMAPSRRTRSWIPFLGRILKTVSGTATEGDIAKVTKALKQLQAQQAHMNDQFVRTEHHLASAVKLSNQRQDALQRLVMNQRLHMSQQYAAIGTILSDLESMIDIVPAMCDRIVQMARALVHMVELRTAIFNAIHGNLDSYLVSHSQMASALHRIRLHLRDIHPRLYIAYRSTGEVYQAHDLLVSRVAKHLYVTIRFPIAISPRPLTIYELRTFSVYMPDNSLHTTRLRTATRAFAYEASLQSYYEFETMPDVNNHMLDITKIPENLQNVTHRSCIMALFDNVAGEIKKYCTFQFHPNSAVSTVVMLDASTVLFNNVSTIIRRCRNMPDTILPGCKQCIHRMPCGCTLHTNEVYIPPTISKCAALRSNATHRVWSHVTNLAVLSQFFSEESLTQLGADRILRRPISANLPPFDIYMHNDSQNIAALDSATLDLHKAVNISIRDDTVYKSHADLTASLYKTWVGQMSDSQFSDHFSFQAILLYVTTGIALLCLGSVVVLSMRLKALSVLFFSVRPTTAIPPIPIHWDYFRTSPDTEMSSVTDTPLLWSAWFQELSKLEICLAVIMTILLLYILQSAFTSVYGKCRQYFQVTKAKYQLWIQFPTKPRAISIPYIVLDYDISCYSFHGPTTAANIKLFGFWSTSMILEWDFTIHNNWLGVPVEQPKTIALTWHQAHILKALLTAGNKIDKPCIYATQLDSDVIVMTFSEMANEQGTPAVSPTAPVDAAAVRRLYPVV